MTAPARIEGVRITPPAAPLTGQVRLPGSKSITNRALLLAGLARGTSRLTGALKSDDTARMAEALRAMGVTVEEPDATSFVVTGTGRLAAPDRALFLGNAGTATRFLTAAAALADGRVVLDGDDYMRKRPIAPLVEALGQLGIEAAAPTGCPPVTVDGKGGFAGGKVVIDARLSSQYASALLMAGACADRPVQVELAHAEIGAAGYIDITLAAMRAFGAKVTQSGDRPAWSIAPGGYRPADLFVEPDASAATYLWAAEVLTGGRIELGMPAQAFSQPDARAWTVIQAFPNMPAVVEGSQMQDAVPTLAVLAAFNAGPVRFTGISGLRVKECDRTAALAQGLARIRPGLAREEGDDLVVEGDPALAGRSAPARIDSHADHRMAMAFSLAGLKVADLVIEDPACVAKTFPGYWDVLASLGVAMEFGV
ncbi:MAG: 3-phosphoshikimate 1-carboxyvinyltransferase [Phenylobacterium sp.]